MWFQEKFEDTKAVIRSRKWTKDRQYPNKKVHEIHTKNNDELMCPGSESSTYTTGGIRYDILVTNPVISNELDWL